MSDQEPFLARWSRRKRATRGAGEEPPPPPAAADALEEGQPRPGAPVPSPAPTDPPAFDPASLPPIDSITANSDIGPYLAAGIPDEVKHAALRRAWSTDPAIRDFVGLAENQWDFNAPNGVPGFGPLQVTEAMKRMIADAMSGAREPAGEPSGLTNDFTGAPAGETMPSAAETESGTADEPHAAPVAVAVGAPPHVIAPCGDVDVAARNEEAEPEPISAERRTHGRALPK